ncbi:MAG: hypothetical protein FD149_1563 [Rhodospirillaceae bacterium]|nr:MAG: hypothetical protein FD149_1563 [Rhodospirillaceae bacterium]
MQQSPIPKVIKSISHATEMAFLEENPDSIAHAVNALLADMAKPKGIKPDVLTAYVWFLSMLLEPLRYSIESGYVWAADLVAAVQERLAQAIRDEIGTPPAWHEILSSFRHVRIPLAPAVRAAFLGVEDADAAELAPHVRDKASDMLKPMLKALVDSGLESPFVLLEQINEVVGDLYPALVKKVLFEHLVTASQPLLRDTAVLMMLDKTPEIRHQAVARIETLAREGTLTPDSVRRLPVIVRWLPAEEQSAAQAMLNAAAGCPAAPWPEPVANLELYATLSDGSGALGVYLTGGKGKDALFGSLLFKEKQGLVEVWCEHPTDRRQTEEMIREARESFSAFAADPDYLDDLVAHGLAVAHPPPSAAMLLRLAEATGRTTWAPRWLDVGTLCAGLPVDTFSSPAALKAVLERSGDWPLAHDFAASWMEAGAAFDAVIDDLEESAHPLTLDAMETAVLDYILEPRRAVWAERLVLSALAVRAATTASSLPPWHDFATLAKVLSDDEPVRTIPLMRTIAHKSIMTAAMEEDDEEEEEN